MTADWTTCRVVRDCEGWLWARVGYRMWMQMDGDMRIGTEGLARFGPLVPVLDAEGLPVVATVGDLTARHLGREVRIEGIGVALLLAMRKPMPDGPSVVALFASIDGDEPGSTDYLPLDTPCEVLS